MVSTISHFGDTDLRCLRERRTHCCPGINGAASIKRARAATDCWQPFSPTSGKAWAGQRTVDPIDEYALMNRSDVYHHIISHNGAFSTRIHYSNLYCIHFNQS
jgi:hypothetical protein